MDVEMEGRKGRAVRCMGGRMEGRMVEWKDKGKGD